MEVIRVRNVHEALPEALYRLRVLGEERGSRNGPVIQFPEPVTTVYERPTERVIFYPERDANPFFHLYESLWMLAGRNDVDSVARYVKRMESFSDDGRTFHGAYGHRWRHWFTRDQLPIIIQQLRANPEDRRCVLQMWDPVFDLGRDGKDFPCNISCIFQVAPDGRLNMTVNNRSNDIVWGAYGANAVHFSYLHEYVARSIGVPVGRYYQVSNNLHAYRNEAFEKVAGLADLAANPFLGKLPNPYYTLEEPYPLMSIGQDAWDEELQMFLQRDEVVLGMREPFFRHVAGPMVRAHHAYKQFKGADRFDGALEHLQRCLAADWKLAAEQWVERRREAWKRAQADGPNHPNE